MGSLHHSDTKQVHIILRYFIIVKLYKLHIPKLGSHWFVDAVIKLALICDRAGKMDDQQYLC